jgi:hypothetical protein
VLMLYRESASVTTCHSCVFSMLSLCVRSAMARAGRDAERGPKRETADRALGKIP